MKQIISLREFTCEDVHTRVFENRRILRRPSRKGFNINHLYVTLNSDRAIKLLEKEVKLLMTMFSKNVIHYAERYNFASCELTNDQLTFIIEKDEE